MTAEPEATTGRCATCKHWRQGGNWRAPSPDHAPEDDRPRWGWCDLIGLPEYSETVTLTAYTKDGSDYKADLHTRDDFGCTLHEPALTPPPVPESETP